MSETKLCCNCLHCARWRRKDGIETHCDLTDKYLGYLQVMDEDNDCKHWEKETKWDLQREHDKQIRAEAIDELTKALCEYNLGIKMYTLEELEGIWADIREIAEKLKEQKDGRV